MYGLSDHSNIIPLTRLSALRQGSSRYSTCMAHILEHTFVAAEDVGCSLVEALRRARGGEGGGDLLHLADPAPALRLRRALGALEPLSEARDRLAPLGEQRVRNA